MNLKPAIELLRRAAERAFMADAAAELESKIVGRGHKKETQEDTPSTRVSAPKTDTRAKAAKTAKASERGTN